MTVRLDELIERIITINHAWKLSRDEFGNDFCATNSFKYTKSSLQATLLREFPQDTYLVVASDNHEQGESMFSVRLRTPVVVNGVVRTDAEHLPVRVANELFTENELKQLINV